MTDQDKVLKFRPPNPKPQERGSSSNKNENADTPNNRLQQEKSNQYALAEQRASKSEDREVEKLASYTTPPSGLIYGTAYFLSIVGDLIDIVLNFIPGPGWLVEIAIGLVFDIPLTWLGFKVKKGMSAINEHGEAITAKIEGIEQKVSLYRQRYAMLLKLSRKSKTLRKPVRKLALKIKNSKARKFLTKNPLTRWLIGEGLDEIPILNFIPWRTLNIYKTKKEHKAAYAEFLLLLPEYQEARNEELAELNQMLEVEAEEAEDEAVYEEELRQAA